MTQTYCTKGDCPESKCIRNFQKQYNIFKVQGIPDPRWEKECPWNEDNNKENKEEETKDEPIGVTKENGDASDTNVTE